MNNYCRPPGMALGTLTGNGAIHPNPMSHFSPTAESFGVSAQIGSGVVRGGPEVRFHEGSTRVPPGFHEVLRGLRGGASTKKSTAVGDIT